MYRPYSNLEVGSKRNDQLANADLDPIALDTKLTRNVPIVDAGNMTPKVAQPQCPHVKALVN